MLWIEFTDTKKRVEIGLLHHVIHGQNRLPPSGNPAVESLANLRSVQLEQLLQGVSVAVHGPAQQIVFAR